MFFHAVRERPQVTTITGLDDSHGNLIQDKAGIQRLCQEYCSQLFAEAPPNSASEAASERILGHMPRLFTDNMRLALEEDISISELRKTLNDMAKDPGPGSDDIAVDYYLAIWNVIGAEFVNMIKSSLEVGSLIIRMTHGQVVMIRKSGARNQLFNWRPITLLNTLCKLLARVLQRRLQTMLSDVIDNV